jgi:ribonuclease VapC
VIVDTSAIVAILRNEPEIATFTRSIVLAPIARISAGSLQELGIVIEGYREPIISPKLDDYLVQSHIVVEPVTEHLAWRGRQAYRAYGKGSGHPARLNFGDCFAYALAIAMNEPLLFKGNDFNHTDVRLAIPPIQ